MLEIANIITSSSDVVKQVWVPIIGPLAGALSGYFIARRNAAVAETKTLEEGRAEMMDRIHSGFEDLIKTLKQERDDYRTEVVSLRKVLDQRERENCDVCPTRANLEKQLGVARTKGE